MCVTVSSCHRISNLSLSAAPSGEHSTVIRYAVQTLKREEIIGVYLLHVEVKAECRYETLLLMDESSGGFIRFDSKEVSGQVTVGLPPGEYRISIVTFAEAEGVRSSRAMTIDYRRHPTIELC